jgi:asparagine synthase (glutamine-hydrolysing)
LVRDLHRSISDSSRQTALQNRIGWQMAGIYGIVAPRNRTDSVTEDRLRRMPPEEVRRGGYAPEAWVGSGIGFCHVRLTSGDRQAVSSSGRYRLVCDGDVRKLTSGRGQPMLATADRPDAGDAVLHHFVAGGLATFARMRGAFAFAAWDDAERRLTLARDRVGTRPLYYVHAQDGSLVFASEIKSLLASGASRPALNHSALPSYLALGAPADDATLVEGIRRVPPGHAVIWQEGHVRLESFWRLPFGSGDAAGSLADASERLESLFESAIRERLHDDVAPGVLMSGSAGSAALLRVLAGMGGAPVHAFSVGFAGQDAQDLEVDRAVARAFGAEHHQVVLTPEEILASLATAIWHRDEPLPDPAAVATYHAMTMAAEHVGVTLGPTGCEELLAGEARHRRVIAAARMARVYTGLPLPTVRKGVRWTAEAVGRRSRWARHFARKLPHAARDVRDVYLDDVAVFRSAEQRDLLTDEAREQGAGSDPYEAIRPLLDGSGAQDQFAQLLAIDLLVRLPQTVATHEILGRAAACASHVPFADDELVEFAAALPPHARGRALEHLLRGTPAAGELSSRRQRRPVTAPVSRWFRGAYRPLLHEYVLGDRALGRGILRPDAVGHLVAEHESGRADHSRQLWSLLNLEVWQRLFVDEEAVDQAPSRSAAAV